MLCSGSSGVTMAHRTEHSDTQLDPPTASAASPSSGQGGQEAGCAPPGPGTEKASNLEAQVRDSQGPTDTRSS